jgi:hypothetical protein
VDDSHLCGIATGVHSILKHANKKTNRGLTPVSKTTVVANYSGFKKKSSVRSRLPYHYVASIVQEQTWYYNLYLKTTHIHYKGRYKLEIE